MTPSKNSMHWALKKQTIANAPADARMAAVMEALDLWPKGESK